MRCDACQEIFCKDHIAYANHKCMSSYKKVTVKTSKCTSCLHVLASDLFLLLLFCRISRCLYVLYATSPSPSREGRCPTLKWANTSTGTADRTPLRERERFPSTLMPLPLPSVCKQNNRASVFQIFTNKCSKGGCKQKEMMRVTCDQCHLNFCLKHRHPLDHDCKPDGKPLSKSGWVQPRPAGPCEGRPSDLIPFPPLRHAAVMRASASSSSASSSSSSGNPWPVSNGMSRAHSSRLELARCHAADVKRALQIEFSLLLSLAPPSGSPPQCQHRVLSLHQHLSRLAW